MAHYFNKVWRLFKLRNFAGLLMIMGYLFDFARGILHGYPGVLIGRNVIFRNKNLIRIGKYTRIEAYCELDGYGSKGITIGSNCKLGRFTIIRVPGDPNTLGNGVCIGDGTTFAEFCFVGGSGFVEIGIDNSIGQYVSLHPQNHMSAGKDVGTSNIGIKVGDNNWIGAKATILDGVVIGNNNIVGAMTLVNKDIKNFQKHIGVPNKSI